MICCCINYVPLSVDINWNLFDVNIVLGGAIMDIIKIGNFIRECRKK